MYVFSSSTPSYHLELKSTTLYMENKQINKHTHVTHDDYKAGAPFKNIETYCLLYGTQRERRLSKAYVPGTGMVAAGQGKARWLTASLLSFQHQGDNTGLQVPWLRASLLSFQLQGYNAGLPVPLGHPHEHNRKAWWRPPWPADFLLSFQAGNWREIGLGVRWNIQACILVYIVQVQDRKYYKIITRLQESQINAQLFQVPGGTYLTKISKHAIRLITLIIVLQTKTDN